MTEYTDSGAVMSDCETWRYRLWRSWRIPFEAGSDWRAVFIGLNPSTATADEDDPTVRRCVRFAASWGCTSMEMLNLYGYRSTDPKGVWGCEDPVGPETDACLVDVCQDAYVVVCCWGAFPQARERSEHVLRLLREHDVQTHVLGLTSMGNPRHPLYMPKASPLIPWPLDKVGG